MQPPAARRTVLVFNWHEPYICLFAHTGHLFHVVPPRRQPHKRWNYGFRPLPANAEEVSWEQAEQHLRQGRYDLVVCLALFDLEVVRNWQVARLFVMLNMVGTDTGTSGAAKEAIVERLRPLFRQIDLAFISDKKQRDWGWEAPVVVSGIDPELYGGYTGELARVLRVGNLLKERDHMQGFSIQEAILGAEFPSAIIGVNPTVPQARPSASWEDLKEQYRRHRLFLNALTEQHEDGYNLSMLEAMATGMPVVSTPNSSSPIIDGHNGFIAADHQVLRQRIRLLLADRELAAELGRNARQTVIDRFHIRDFIAGWNRVFAQCVARWAGRSTASTAAPPLVKGPHARSYPLPLVGKAPPAAGKRLKILLAAPANPLSTSAYYERVLRRSHEVLTCGPRLDEAMLRQWKVWEDQHALKPSGAGDMDKMGLLARLVRENDLPLPWGQADAGELAGRLPRGWRPDAVVWIDAGPDFLLENPGHFDCPTICLIGDTHTGQRQWRLEYARQFAQVFLMFVRQDIPVFAQGGCSRVEWLPAACEPQIHRCFGVPRAYDIVFCGQTLRQWHPHRVRLLERLQQAGFDLRVESKILEEMALLFSRGRIVFNRSLNGDLNMRVFEALSCGSLLLTDRLPKEAGLEWLFADRQHLVLYGEDDIEELARYYLENEEEREAIAAAGRQAVLERHTYGHRADQFLAAVFGEGACASCAVQAEPLPRPALPSRGPRASIVIPLFNKAEFTEQCLHALVRNSGVDPDYEVVVVDNGSTDWTAYLLHAFGGDLRVLHNEQNTGFARACNQGAEAARGEYLVLLNNDTLPQSGWLAALVRLADSDSRIGIVGARLLYPGTRQIQHAGLELVNGVPDHVYRGVDADDPRVNQARDVDMVTGACMLVRRQLFQQLGGLDVEYVNGVEDVDLCLRVRQAGFRVVYCPDCVVEHHEGTSEGRFERVRENLRRFNEKWGGRFDANGRFVPSPQPGQETPAAPPASGGGFRGNWEGGFFLHSSLAHVNRELALALLGTGRCELGLIPCEPHQFGPGEDARFGALEARLDQPLREEVDFHLRHRWPPDFSRPAAGRLILIQPWEFGRIPRAWVQPLQEQVDQIWAPTAYVRQCYIDSGIDPEKVVVVPQGVDPERFRPGLEPLPLPTQKRFKFLFVGGTLYRKGIDLLLAAYGAVFSPDDEVCLVIKDMGVNTFYRNQNAGEQIRRLQQDPAYPQILYLTEDLPVDQLPRLYAACDCLVHPYRGEGFGLPVAEALACGLPAILTRGGACDDFAPEEETYWVPARSRQVRFQEETAGPAWLLEPELEALKERLRQVFADPQGAGERGRRASQQVRSRFTWERAAAQALEALGRLEQQPGAPLPARVEQVELSGDELGERLEAIRRAGQADYLAVAAGAWPARTLQALVDHLERQPQMAMVSPALEPGGGGEVLEEADYPAPGWVVLRLSALAQAGGFDEAFHGPAVLANAARCCRRQGLQVGAARDCPAPAGALEWAKQQAAQPEWRAVVALEEGDRLRGAGRLPEAAAALQRAVAEKQDFVEAILVLTDVLVELGRAKEAVRVVERLAQLDPRSCQAYNYLGLVQTRAECWEEARASFKRAVELEPHFAEALVNLGVLEWEQGQAAAAFAYFDQAARLDPANRELVANLALLYARAGHLDAAIAALREYLAIQPDDEELLGQLAEALWQKGEVQESRRVALRLLERRPDHPGARAIVEQNNGKE